jgi:hypothetical protein
MRWNGIGMAEVVFEQIEAIEHNGHWAWILALDRDGMFAALEDWFREQVEVAPGTREHLALSAAVILYRFEQREGLEVGQ